MRFPSSELMKRVREKPVPFWEKLAGRLPSGRILVPVSSLAMLLILCLALFRYTYFTDESGPSAIVDSFTGNVTSVVIIETPESRQTIIWFSETPDLAGDQDEV